ncbi:MAG TPA: 5-oxoprolinase subunit PxpA [Jatrophihabitans sp.]|nr:5-oxoprolinase subunit PxpA [Jatrophihabitans sp.]
MDLNADLGEGFGAWSMGADEELLKIVTSANIACGFHAGDPSIMRRTVDIAAQNGVAVGAHVSYPDIRGFGRRDMDLPLEQVTDDVLYQIGALDSFARAAGTPVAYVKPHGALYNRIAVDEEVAGAVALALARYDRPLPLLALPDSAAAKAAAQVGVRAVAEGFADRAYHPDGRLVSRHEGGAVITDPEAVAARAVAMARDGHVVTAGGERLMLEIDSLCVHGDSPGAVELARSVRNRLIAAGIALRAFAPDDPPSNEAR